VTVAATLPPTASSGSDLSAYAGLLDSLRVPRPVEPDVSALVDAAVEVWSRPGFDTLLSLPRLAFEPFDYQAQTAQTVLRRMRGRAILADEVGLGKTIEAGLILAELRVRGMAGRALVITPAGLVEQWRDELERKFGIPTTVARGEWDATVDSPVVLASIATARRNPTLDRLTACPWDLIVIDEAHRVRGPRSASGRLARTLTSRYLLLLTATPVENKLQDLYELVSLAAPGLLGTPQQFRDRHAGPAKADDGPQTLRNLDELRERTREVMVRHRRREVAVMLPPRIADTVLVAPGEDEARLYLDIAGRIRASARSANGKARLTLRHLARLAGSSPVAVAPTLAKIGWDDLGERARAIAAPAKTAVLLDKLASFAEREEKVLVFTAFRTTLDHLAGALNGAGLSAVNYHGSLSRQDKEKAIAAFRDAVPILLTTESAGEGRNLQFCHVMVNVDLPWNPMQIEQRLGRLHRVGQRHDVLLTNLVARGTIEQRILHVLEAKINLFELVVGELDMILGRVDDEFDFEASVFEAFTQSVDDEEFARRLEVLGSHLADARGRYLESRGAVDALVGSDHETGRR
jgi:SNF2 family DNA or RNA helicase